MSGIKNETLWETWLCLNVDRLKKAGKIKATERKITDDIERTLRRYTMQSRAQAKALAWDGRRATLSTEIGEKGMDTNGVQPRWSHPDSNVFSPLKLCYKDSEKYSTQDNELTK